MYDNVTKKRFRAPFLRFGRSLGREKKIFFLLVVSPRWANCHFWDFYGGREPEGQKIYAPRSRPSGIFMVLSFLRFSRQDLCDFRSYYDNGTNVFGYSEYNRVISDGDRDITKCALGISRDYHLPTMTKWFFSQNENFSGPRFPDDFSRIHFSEGVARAELIEPDWRNFWKKSYFLRCLDVFRIKWNNFWSDLT